MAQTRLDLKDLAMLPRAHEYLNRVTLRSDIMILYWTGLPKFKPKHRLHRTLLSNSACFRFRLSMSKTSLARIKNLLPLKAH